MRYKFDSFNPLLNPYCPFCTVSTNTLPAGGGSATVSSTNKGPDKHTTPKPKAVTSTHALTTVCRVFDIIFCPITKR